MTLTDWMTNYAARDWQQSSGGTVRYALVGLGWWTTDVALPAIAASEFCETTVLVSSSAEKAGRVAEEHDVDYGITYDEYHEGVAADAYDAVYIATPNAFHLDYAETAAKLGKGVLCEKPMEATVERAEQMVDVCDEADVPLMVAYRMQTDPAVRRARELVEDGFLGDPVQVYGNNSQPLLETIPNHDQWRLDPDLTGYGTSVMDLGIYSINTTRFLLRRDFVTVESRMSSHHEAFDSVPDERSSFLAVLEGDVQMVCTASQRAHADTQLKITGTEGQLELRPAFHGECTLLASKGDVSVELSHESFEAVEEMTEEFDYFADRLLSDVPVYPDGAHGLADMRIVEAIHRAADSESTVTLD
ncbi:glucose-fructose oxidoreductase [Haloprofundus marisrubri]|uniref:Glucose-fructose oxidoreductase n=1 Tax=Haloprofundus marisrubri TaxID=1514971 RepID=A0A0W1R354_9EURY|nr:D-xylose 1-dehydrogenase Gfo6 [Haloprofundus marisrubri]KTG07768.1 glucose-fructose oxidoreductase [Haloprofundus marisrubri]